MAHFPAPGRGMPEAQARWIIRRHPPAPAQVQALVDQLVSGPLG